MVTPLVSAVSAGFSYEHPVLSGFDLECSPGSITALVGLNGAGKTTALRLLSGQLKPDVGRVRIEGADPLRAATRRRLFFLPEETDLPGHLSARELVVFYSALYAGPRLQRDHLQELLMRVGLNRVARKRATTFSKGMRRRLELAALLAVDVPVWLLDEPQNGLDPEGLGLLRTLCREARDSRRAVVMATHDLADVRDLADRVVLLRDGRTIFAGDRQALIEHTGARSYEVRGGGPQLDQAVTELVRASGASLEGPSISPGSLEELLFGLADGAEAS